jgi:hypothetical protein
MEVLPFFFIAFFLIVFALPLFLAEDDRPGAKRPDVKARQAVGAWFFRR